MPIPSATPARRLFCQFESRAGGGVLGEGEEIFLYSLILLYLLFSPIFYPQEPLNAFGHRAQADFYELVKFLRIRAIPETS